MKTKCVAFHVYGKVLNYRCSAMASSREQRKCSCYVAKSGHRQCEYLQIKGDDHAKEITKYRCLHLRAIEAADEEYSLIEKLEEL